MYLKKLDLQPATSLKNSTSHKNSSTDFEISGRLFVRSVASSTLVNLFSVYVSTLDKNTKQNSLVEIFIVTANAKEKKAISVGTVFLD